MTKINSLLLSDKLSTAFWISLLVTFFVGLAAPRTLAFMPSLTGIGFALTLAFTTKQFIGPKKQELILCALILTFALLSSFWAPEQNFAIVRAIKIALIILPGLLLVNISRHVTGSDKISILPILVGLHFIAALFFMTEKLSDHQILEWVLDKEINSFKLNRSFVVFILFSLPVLFLIQTAHFGKVKKIALFCFVLLTTITTLSVTESQTAQVTFVVGLFFLLIFPIKCRFTFKALATGLVLLTLLLPFLIQPLKSAVPEEILLGKLLREASMVHRLEVWSYAADKALASPIYGNGIEALRFMKAEQWMEHQKSYNALHAHNVVLQIWAEFGIIGIILGIAFLLYLFRSVDHVEDLQTRRLYLTLFMACFSISLTGYGFWQGWQLGLFILISAFVLAIGRSRQTNI